jgi:DNA-binding CsgD family transcriptional regulator
MISARGVSDSFLDLYEREGRRRDPLFQRVQSGLRTICSEFDLNRDERRAFQFQSEISSGCVARAIEAPILVGGELVGTLNVARHERDRRFTRHEVDRVTLIARHTSLAIARLKRESDLLARSVLVEEVLDTLSLPMIVSDLRGNIVYTNTAAVRFLANREYAIELAVYEAAKNLSEKSLHIPPVVVARAGMRRPKSGKPNVTAPSAGLTMRSCRVDAASAIVTLIYDTPAEVARPLSLLSRREREIAEFVVRGLTNVQIASTSSISRNTVKRHLKHVFEKLNVGSRAELAAIIAGDAAAAHGDLAWAAHMKLGNKI